MAFAGRQLEQRAMLAANDRAMALVQEMARLEVDPSVAGLKVSGVYRVGDNEAFARSIAKLLPITVRQEEDSYRLVPDQQG